MRVWSQACVLFLNCYIFFDCQSRVLCAHVSLVSVCVYCLSLWQGICDDSECVLCSRACFTKRISHAYNQCDFKYSFSAQYNVNEDSLQWCDY